MRLDFNVLWVEDQVNAVESQRARIDRQLRKEGFKLQVKFVVSVDEAVSCLASDIYGDHVDLVLMDYDLGRGTPGDEGLVQVRSQFAYKDIVFYSARASDISTLVAEKNVQGVYCSTRHDLPDTVEGVFLALVKKVLDIDHSRGIVMGASSDIDYQVNECLRELFDKGNDVAKKASLELISSSMKKIRTRIEKAYQKIAGISHIAELFDHHLVYTSNDRLNLLRKLLEGKRTFTTQLSLMKKYATKTIPKRNDLAHLRVQRRGFSRKLINRAGQELTSEQMRQLRLDFLELQEMFDELGGKLLG